MACWFEGSKQRQSQSPMQWHKVIIECCVDKRLGLKLSNKSKVSHLKCSKQTQWQSLVQSVWVSLECTEAVVFEFTWQVKQAKQVNLSVVSNANGKRKCLSSLFNLA